MVTSPSDIAIISTIEEPSKGVSPDKVHSNHIEINGICAEDVGGRYTPADRLLFLLIGIGDAEACSRW